ncbi:deoxyribonuclease TATDN3 [Fennellomyces sp. T-0311]|nr:deoxyribonuclease TATDN3 [Fennellomyces sp. T-0311]
MIDVHAHINNTNFPHQTSDAAKITFDHVLTNAAVTNVTRVVSLSETIHDAPNILELAEQSNGLIKPGVGLHPVQRVDTYTSPERSATLEDLDRFQPLLEKAIASGNICCVGEIGLDFSPHIVATNPHNQGRSEEELREIQRQVFRRQIELAIAANLPVNVHSRSAGHHALDVLYECKATKVNMHAFSGRASYTKKAVEAGYYFSLPPSIIHSPHLQKVAAAVPLSNLLLESDAPCLGPEKGVDNDPASILISAQEIARIKSVSVEQVIEQTTANAKALFGPSI